MNKGYEKIIDKYATLATTNDEFELYKPLCVAVEYKITIIEEYNKGELIKKTEIREPVWKTREEEE